MSDLVERLRRVPGALAPEAADRIEALEKALWDCVAELSICAKQLSARPDGSVSLALNKAREALAPEQDK